jgi:hypothetical protein
MRNAIIRYISIDIINQRCDLEIRMLSFLFMSYRLGSPFLVFLFPYNQVLSNAVTELVAKWSKLGSNGENNVLQGAGERER